MISSASKALAGAVESMSTAVHAPDWVVHLTVGTYQKHSICGGVNRGVVRLALWRGSGYPALVDNPPRDGSMG
jgi:hypothetical protein